VQTTVDPRALESLLAFWRDAGVADAFEDEPQDRTIEVAQRLRATAPPPDALAPVPALAPIAPAQAEAAAQAREAALAADTLEALATAAAAFEGSALRYCGARRCVFARGPADAEVLVIGDAPGADEDAEGRPFAGRAGALLDRALALAGLSDRALLTYTVFWRPPGDRAPNAEEQATLAPFLDRAISLARPKLLLVLGAGAAASVLRQSGGIRALRGRWFEHETDDGALRTPAAVTLPPALLLGQPLAKRLFWADLLAVAAKLSENSGVNPSET
jgi:DNA polymerase